MGKNRGNKGKRLKNGQRGNAEGRNNGNDRRGKERGIRGNGEKQLRKRICSASLTMLHGARVEYRACRAD